ncbi:MAG: hypothetical protein IJ883_06250 [Eubacterium sp.]|nr:hypothetical protein [Eubacterium sp.]
MKTRVKQMICMVVLVSMVCVYALGTTNTRAVLKDPQVSPRQMGNLLAGKVSKKDSKSTKAKKTETVYIELNGDGSVDKTTVSDVIEAKGKDPITDESILKNIKNLKGDEKYTEKMEILLGKIRVRASHIKEQLMRNLLLMFLFLIL